VVDGTTELSDLWVVDGVIRLERPAGAATRHYDGVVLPGLVDVHCHIGLGATGAVPPEVAREQATINRDTGVLLIRDAGVPREPYSTRWMDQDPEMPRLIRCGQHIARQKRYMFHLPRNVEPHQLPDVVEEEALAGDGWVKLIGDWIDRSLDVPDLELLWPDDILRAAAVRAHAVGARLTIHVFSREGAAQALRCGLDCIEHGTGMDAELMSQAVRQGVAVVPTMMQRDNFALIADAGQGKYPVWETQLRSLYETRYSQALELHQAGVTLLLGSDQSTGIPHGQVAREAGLMAKAGIPADAVVQAASWGTRRFLGFPGIEDGASADLVVYGADPRQDITQLRTPRSVILRGRQVCCGQEPPGCAEP